MLAVRNGHVLSRAVLQSYLLFVFRKGLHSGVDEYAQSMKESKLRMMAAQHHKAFQSIFEACEDPPKYRASPSEDIGNDHF